jgi:hypothetical protein
MRSSSLINKKNLESLESSKLKKFFLKGTRIYRSNIVLKYHMCKKLMLTKNKVSGRIKVDIKNDNVRVRKSTFFWMTPVDLMFFCYLNMLTIAAFKYEYDEIDLIPDIGEVFLMNFSIFNGIESRIIKVWYRYVSQFLVVRNKNKIWT